MKMYTVYFVGTSNVAADRVVATGPRMAKALAMHLAGLKTDAYLVAKICKSLTGLRPLPGEQHEDRTYKTATR